MDLRNDFSDVERKKCMEKRHVVFVTTVTASNKTAEENLGIGYLAAVCEEQGFEVHVIDGWLENMSLDEVINRIPLHTQPLCIGFSCNQLNGITAIEAAKILKKRGCDIPLVAGGFAPTFDPGKFLKGGFDFVSIAEGELCILEIANRLSKGQTDLYNIPGIAYLDGNGKVIINPTKSVDSLDMLPFPNRKTMKFVVANKTPVNMATSRGCMSNCLFCSISAFWKMTDAPQWRGRGYSNIVDEIEYLYNKGVRHIKFVDDSFLEPPRDDQWCENFANLVQERKIDVRLRITLRADRVTERSISALTRAGCNLFCCGIENFSDSALRRMGKRASSAVNQNALDIFKQNNVYVQMGFILFDYGTTMEELKENYRLLNKYSWTICRGVFSEMYAAKGTRYTSLLMNKGIIKGDIYLENYTYEICDPKARMAYYAIKAWHISHMRMYNLVIEPINKPKVIDDDLFHKFYLVYQEIRKRDLEFMGEIIDLIDTGVENGELNDYVRTTIQENKKWFEECQGKINQLYALAGIDYVAEEDPFTVQPCL